MPALGKESLLAALDFKKSPTGKYVTYRETRNSRPSTSADVNAEGTVNIRITGDGWLDVESLVIVLTINTTARCYPLSPFASSLIQSMQTYIQGTPCERIDHYNRACAAFRTMMPEHITQNEIDLGFGMGIRAHSGDPAADATDCFVNGSAVTVVIRPWLLGMVRAGKYLPLLNAAPSIEFTLAKAALVFGSGASYHVNNVYARHDIVQLNAKTQSEIMEGLLENKSIQLAFPSIHTQMVTVTAAAGATSATAVRATTSKAFTRLIGAVATFAEAETSAPDHMIWPGGIAGDGITQPHRTNADCLRFRLQVGTRAFPDRPVESLRELFLQLQDFAGESNQDVRSMSIKGAEFRTNKFVLVQNLMKVVGNPSTGETTRQGSPVTVEIENIKGCRATQMYLFLPHLLTASLEDRGVVVAN